MFCLLSFSLRAVVDNEVQLSDRCFIFEESTFFLGLTWNYATAWSNDYRSFRSAALELVFGLSICSGILFPSENNARILLLINIQGKITDSFLLYHFKDLPKNYNSFFSSFEIFSSINFHQHQNLHQFYYILLFEISSKPFFCVKVWDLPHPT